jgi:enolase
MVNVLSGRAHGGADTVDFQDFLVVPVGAASFAEAIEWAARVRRVTAELVAGLGLPSRLVAEEGGLGPPLASNRAAVELLAAGIERSGLAPGEQAAIALDVAGSHRAGGEAVEELGRWCAELPIVSVEDPAGEDDWAAWSDATRRLAGVQVVGDDLFATDLLRLERGIAEGAANAVLVKPNQTGTLSSAAAVVERAREAGYATVVSARSGDTEESWLADLAVGWRAGQIKVGSTTRSERTAKWNRLLEIEAEAGGAARFAGAAALAPQARR